LESFVHPSEPAASTAPYPARRPSALEERPERPASNAAMPSPLRQDAPAILVVDDSADNLSILSRFLHREGCRVHPASSGEAALEIARRNRPDLILLDINLPGMNGFEVCRLLKQAEALRDIPVLFLSALDEALDKVKAFEAGGVDYITKPFQFEEVLSRVTTHLKIHDLQKELERHNRNLADTVAAQVKEISESQLATIFALAKLAESRDGDTGKHLERVQIFCRLLATRLREGARDRDHIGSVYLENIYRASPLHDIGKVGILDRILLKPAKLSSDEFETMKAHTTLGAQTLEAVRHEYPKNAFINIGIAIARSHHERWDGTGYPEGLAGEKIPLSARIMAVADVYDALRSKRCYKPAFSHETSRTAILDGAGTHFDPLVAKAFGELETDFGTIWDAHRE
jgi:putative two-component system response regulator